MNIKGNILQSLGGFFTVLIVVFIFIFLNANHNLFNKEDCTKIFAKFDNALGLSVGSAVRTSGIKIGEVKSIKIDDSDRVIVCMCIQKEVSITQDASAAISYENFFSGTRFINIENGSSQDKLKDSEHIYITRSALDLEEIVRNFVHSFT